LELGLVLPKGHGILKIKMLAPASIIFFSKISAILGEKLLVLYTVNSL
jgi:hypothetical protein